MMPDNDTEKAKKILPAEYCHWAAILIAALALVFGFKAAFIDTYDFYANPVLGRYGGLIFMLVYFGSGAVISLVLWFIGSRIRKTRS